MTNDITTSPQTRLSSVLPCKIKTIDNNVITEMERSNTVLGSVLSQMLQRHLGTKTTEDDDFTYILPIFNSLVQAEKLSNIKTSVTCSKDDDDNHETLNTNILECKDTSSPHSVMSPMKSRRLQALQKRKRSVHFCSFDLSTAVFGDLEEQHGILVASAILECLICILSNSKSARDDEKSTVTTLGKLLSHLSTTYSSVKYHKVVTAQCVEMLQTQLSRIIITSNNNALPFQERFVELVSSLVRMHLRIVLNGTEEEEEYNNNAPPDENVEGVSQPILRIKAGTGSFQHNDDSLSALVNYALRMVYTTSYVNNNTIEENPSFYEAQMEHATAKLFLLQLFGHEGFIEHMEKDTTQKDCWDQISYYAELIKRFECHDIGHFIPLLDIPAFTTHLRREEKSLKKMLRTAKSKLCAKKSPASKKRFTKQQLRFPKLQSC